jgi:hypothetical protein
VPEVLEARASEARQASGGAADGAMISAALRGGSCASVLESGDEGDSYESVALATALPLSSGAAAEGAPASSAAPKGLCEGTLRRDFSKGQAWTFRREFRRGSFEGTFRRV